MNGPLETLLLAFSGNAGLAVPSGALFIGAEAHEALRKWPELSGWQPWKPKADAWQRAGFPLVEDLAAGKWPLVMVLPGKSRDETLAWFAMARDHLQPGGTIVVAMPNTAGAGRFEKEFQQATGTIVSLQKNKCRAFHATEDGTWNEALFGEWRLLGEPRFIPSTEFIVQAGIFSGNRVDPGSELLASHLPANLHGNVADLGAAWGYLSHAARLRCPGITRLDLFEADSRALACARINLARHPENEARLASPPCLLEDGPELAFHWHDVTTGLPGTYDAILMNPPFHSGQATDISLGRAFLKVALSSLNRGGKLLLVANRQLPYETILQASGLPWRKLVEDRTYKVLSAIRS